MLSANLSFSQNLEVDLLRAVETIWDKVYKVPIFLFGIPFILIGVMFFVKDGNLAFMLNGVFGLLLVWELKLKAIIINVILKT